VLPSAAGAKAFGGGPSGLLPQSVHKAGVLVKRFSNL